MAFSFPSISYLAKAAGDAFRRFPLAVLSAVLAATCAVIMVESDNHEALTVLNLMLSGALGIPLFVGIGVLNQRLSQKTGYILYAAALLLLLLIFFTLPMVDTTFNRSRPYFRYAVYNAVAHLFVAVGPYFHRGELNGFWNYNKSLFLRFLLSLLYSIVLYAGIALALFTVDTLFKVEIKPDRYFEVFIVIIWVFNTWFFVSGLPSEFTALENSRSYPKGLRIFCQFVLVPLLVIYLIILYVYGGKIIFTWDWPEGIVSYLIMIIATSGILTMLLLHPFAQENGGGWISLLRRAYYILLLPLTVILFLAIGIRISDYGFTVNRYLILLTGIWITMAAVFSIFRPHAIKFLPASLGILFLICSFGYWGMFSVSERDQVDRLYKILSENGLLENGKVVNEVHWEVEEFPDFKSSKELINNNVLTDSLHNEVISILDYLDEYHGFERISPWFEQDVEGLIRQSIEAETDTNSFNDYRNESGIFANTIGLQSSTKYEGRRRFVNLQLIHEENPAISIQEFNYLLDMPEITFSRVIYEPELMNYAWSDENLYLAFDSTSNILSVEIYDSLKFNYNIERIFAEAGNPEDYPAGEDKLRINLRFPDETGISVLILKSVSLQSEISDNELGMYQIRPLILYGRSEKAVNTP